jgi:hypothetical protein
MNIERVIIGLEILSQYRYEMSLGSVTNDMNKRFIRMYRNDTTLPEFEANNLKNNGWISEEGGDIWIFKDY